MQIKTILAATFATVAVAAPTPAIQITGATQNTVVGTWTIRGATRTCNSGNTQCTWTFGVDRRDGSAIKTCTFKQTGSPASQSDITTPQACGGPYTVTLGWSGIFGPGNGFSTLALKDRSAGLISYPSYEDSALANGKAVSPDRSFNVETCNNC